MSALSAFPADAAAPAPATGPRVRVWDAPVRVFHWLMALSFAGAWITADSERWRALHVTLGYTVGGLVANAFGRLPKRGEAVEIGGFRFRVLRADSRRLHTLNVTRLPQGGLL